MNEKLSVKEQEVLFDIITNLKADGQIYNMLLFKNVGSEDIYDALKKLILDNLIADEG